MIADGLRYIERYLNTITLSDNAEVTLSGGLPRGYLYHRLILRLSGTLQIATAAATALKDTAPASLIKEIKVVANGKNVLKSIDGATLYRINSIKRGTTAPLTAPGLTVTTHAFSCLLLLDFTDPKNRVEIDTQFNSNGMSTFDLILRFGTTTDLVTPDTGTVLSWSVTPTVQVATVESLFNAKISPSQRFPLNTEYIAAEKEVTASSSKFQIDLATGNLYRTLIIKATDAGTPENDIINNITLKSGSEVFFYKPGLLVRDENKADLALETMPAGFYVIDLAKYGSLADLLDARAMSNLQLEFDVTKGSGTTLIKVVAQEIILPAEIAKV